MYIAGWIRMKEFFKELPPQTKKLISSRLEVPSLELKPLSKDLKYAFWDLRIYFQ